MIDVHQSVDLLLGEAQVQTLSEKLHVIQQRDRRTVLLKILDGAAIGVQLSRIDAVDLIARYQLVGVLQDCLVAYIERVRATIRAIHHVLPLRHDVDRLEQRKSFLLEPFVGLLCFSVGRINTGELTHDAVPVRNGYDTLVLLSAPLFGDNAAGDESICSNASLPVRVFSALERVVVGAAWFVDGAPVVGREDHEGVVPHALVLHRFHNRANIVVQVVDHCGVEPPV
mmetsp:Transcript_73135/g.152670  ORF Transcript_73135/g.152670 Transcript_73135/m.152670 type:complete len:227 (+) Transcript_73135:708-1388(+)